MMAQSFEFAILQASPDNRRGEQVNVGLVVFLASKLDVRIPESRKLRALTGFAWDDVSRTYAQHIAKAFNPKVAAAEMIGSMDFTSSVFALSGLGTIRIDRPDEYEGRVESILDNLVLRPKLTPAQRQQRINTEIARVLRTAKVLAKQGQTIDDHKVVTKFVVSPSKKAVADFAYKNGTLRVVSTLDLRGDKDLHVQACVKGATLHFARETYGNDTRRIGVVAVEMADIKRRRSEIEILKDFADGKVFNWLDPKERKAFQRALY
jgi:hypothetical protein